MGELRAGAKRTLLVTHSSALSGAELGLIEMAPRLRGGVVCVFQTGPLVDALVAAGIEVHVLQCSGVALDVRRDSGLLGILRAVPGTLRLARALVRLSRPGDLFYGNSQKAWVVCAIAAALSRRPALWHLHDILSREHFSGVQARIGVWLANRYARAVIVNSHATGESVVNQGGRRDLLRVAHNGLDLAPFRAVERLDRGQRRRQLGIPEHVLLVGLFGRITAWKGQHVLLEALKELPGVAAIIVGAPLFGEHEYLHDLERAAAGPALAGRVTFLGFRRDVVGLMRAVDIVVHASTAAEPFGRVIVEAMLSRRPVVATRGGGVPEILTDGVTGLLVPPADAGALAAALRRLFGDPQLAENLVKAGHAKAMDEFTLDRMVSRINGILQEADPA